MDKNSVVKARMTGHSVALTVPLEFTKITGIDSGNFCKVEVDENKRLIFTPLNL